jgi:hypothetical protein
MEFWISSDIKFLCLAQKMGVGKKLLKISVPAA